MVIKKSIPVKKGANLTKKVMVEKKLARDTSAVTTAFTKSQILAEISRMSLLNKKEVIAVFEELSQLISRHLKKGSIGLFNMPGLFKITTVHKPAVKARKGTNPFNGEEMVFKAKPARTAVKIRALKALKDMV